MKINSNDLYLLCSQWRVLEMYNEQAEAAHFILKKRRKKIDEKNEEGIVDGNEALHMLWIIWKIHSSQIANGYI